MRRLARALALAVGLTQLMTAPAVAHEPEPVPEHPAYVGSQSCTSCHQAATAAWEGSHHAAAWTWPSPDTVRADFDGTSFTHRDGMTARFSTDGATYQVEVTETDGTTTTYPVHSVAGIAPLQQYLLETAPGQLQSFDVVWDTEAGGWFHLYPDQDLPPDDGLHWTGPYKSWNARCAECHATGYEKAYDARTRSYASTQAEIGVGCEACHGPGAAHLAQVAGRPVGAFGVALDRYGFSQSFASTEATIQQCATCHARREAHDDASPLPGTAFADAYSLALLRPGLYQADGQILDEVYVYGSFLQSKMYAAGVGCLDCHDAHRAEPVAAGNAVCTQCHAPAGNPAYPELRRALYDDPAHHFHARGSDGGQCIACHAPKRVYMGNDWRADHSFRVPRPDLAGTTGATDACTTCHTDRSPDWAARKIAEWYPNSRHRGPHYGETLAQGRRDPAAHAGALIDLAHDRRQPELVRATAAWLLQGTGDGHAAQALAPLIADEAPVVRAAAVALQQAAPPQDRVLRLLPALRDPTQTVRLAAARTLLGAPIARLPAADAEALTQAMVGWRASLASRLDFPETHLQLGGMALTMRAFDQATAAFEEAVRLDPQRAEAWAVLVRIAVAREGAAAGRAVLDAALAAAPDDPGLRALDAQLP